MIKVSGINDIISQISISRIESMIEEARLEARRVLGSSHFSATLFVMAQGDLFTLPDIKVCSRKFILDALMSPGNDSVKFGVIFSVHLDNDYHQGVGRSRIEEGNWYRSARSPGKIFTNHESIFTSIIMVDHAQKSETARLLSQYGKNILEIDVDGTSVVKKMASAFSDVERRVVLITERNSHPEEDKKYFSITYEDTAIAVTNLNNLEFQNLLLTIKSCRQIASTEEVLNLLRHLK